MSPINIAYICNETYALCTGVSIFSLKCHRNPGREYCVYIVCTSVTERSVNLFRTMDEKGFTIKIIDVDKLLPTNKKLLHLDFPERKPHHLKFNLAELIPDCSKILYLDGDTLIHHSLDSLYDYELGTCYAAACADIGAEFYPESYKTRLGLQHPRYFNSGVMLLNLTKFREDSIGEALWEYRINGANYYVDQDAFNTVIGHQVIFIPIYWNVISVALMNNEISTEMLNDYYGYHELCKIDYYLHANIAHYTSLVKPWKYENVLGSKEWIRYYKKSPFVSIKINRLNRAISPELYKLVEYTERNKRKSQCFGDNSSSSCTD